MTLFQYAMILIHMKEKVIGGKGKKPTIEKEVKKINIKKEEYREQFTWSWTL